MTAIGSVRLRFYCTADISKRGKYVMRIVDADYKVRLGEVYAGFRGLTSPRTAYLAPPSETAEGHRIVISHEDLSSDHQLYIVAAGSNKFDISANSALRLVSNGVDRWVIA